MAKQELIVYAQKELEKLSPNKLKVISKETQLIFSKFEELDEAMETAEYLERKTRAHANRGIGTKLWEHLPFIETGAEKLAKLNTQAITQQNKRQAIMEDMLQNTIMLIAQSHATSMAMYLLLAQAMTDGFEGTNGRYIELKGKTKELALQVQETIGAVITQKIEMEKRHSKGKNSSPILSLVVFIAIVLSAISIVISLDFFKF